MGFSRFRGIAAVAIVTAACHQGAGPDATASQLVTPDVGAQGPELAAQGAEQEPASAPTLAEQDAGVAQQRGLLSTNDASNIEAACSQRCVTIYDNCSWRAQVACIDRCVMTGAGGMASNRYAGPSSSDVAGIPLALDDAHVFDVELGELGNCASESMW